MTETLTSGASDTTLHWVWFDEKSVTHVVDESGRSLPVQTALTNYPNPFNSRTTVEYNLSQSGYTTVSVYDLQGKHITTLVDSNQSAGKHSVVWDTQRQHTGEVASGIYLIALNTGESVSVTKTILIQ